MFYNSKDVLYRVAKAISEEVRAKNNDFMRTKHYESHTGIACLAPIVNIMRHPLWGRNQVIFKNFIFPHFLPYCA